jgi:hypothetical protein
METIKHRDVSTAQDLIAVVQDRSVNRIVRGEHESYSNSQYGGPEVMDYKDIPDPSPGPGEVLVRIAATSINPFDRAA